MVVHIRKKKSNKKSATIMLRSENYDGNNKLTYQFPSPFNLTNCEISVLSYSFYNSFFNLSKALLSIRIPSFSADNTLAVINVPPITIPDGNYSVDSLITWLQQTLISRKYALYKVSTNTSWYPYEFVNINPYSIGLNVYYYPTASQAASLGLSLISGSTVVLNPATTNPLQVAGYLNISLSGGTNFLGTYLGFATGFNYPTFPLNRSVTSTTYVSTPFSFTSTTIPKLSPVDQVCV